MTSMNLAVLDFSYAGMTKSIEQATQNGFYSVNLGDNAQTIAARSILERLGVPASEIARVDRDTLPHYSGPSVALIMNGVFYERNFPVPPSITPIFVGFCTKSTELVAQHRDWFIRHGPVGCRDFATAALMREAGIDAFVTGCITMTLPRREQPPRRRRFLVVHGSGSGLLPPAVLKHIPARLMDRAEFIYHRLPSNEIPLSTASRAWIENYEQHLLHRYRDEAALVLTPLLHVASPCLGMGVPVIVCRRDRDSRFGFLEGLMPIHTPDDADKIRWNIGATDIGTAAETLIETLTNAIARIKQGWDKELR
ncbi:MAG: polysaccharide pyruvyl transferase family protein [Pseudomonadota bacterium]|jgi:hypothetical protein|nr:hypothetical protein LTR94_017075 [Friedmanniomyces endolithicus]NBB42144.1 hypothetical protein [Sphingobium yanoikuyae]